MERGKADLILHPVRMRILQAFSFGSDTRERTAQQLAAMMPDIPQATLYRHLNTLVAGGILQVVAQRPVRGTTERVYALPEAAAILTMDDLATASREDHLRYFATFLATLLGDFARYLRRDAIDYVEDMVGYRQMSLYLSDEELRDLLGKLNALLEEALANQPSPGRRRRVLSRIVMPADDAPGAAVDE